MDGATGEFEAETIKKNMPKPEVGEVKSPKIELIDARGDMADSEQAKVFENRIHNNVEGKLMQFESLMGPYTKQKVTEGLAVNLTDGPVGNGEVLGGKLSVNLPNSDEIKAANNDERAKPFLSVLDKVGVAYEDYALAVAESTTLHESEHMIIDSRPGSKLEEDFKDETGITNDTDGHTLSLLDEGITYAFQLENDSESEMLKKLEGEKPQTEDSFTIKTRKVLGEKLREKVREYTKDGIQIDKDFLKFAGEEMKKLNIEKYVALSKLQRSLRGIDCRTEQWNNFESREFDNPTVVLEKLVVEGYCFHGSSRKIDGEIEPRKAVDLAKPSGNKEAVYMTINPLLAEFAGIYGGAEGITKRENSCHMEINDGKVSYPGESIFGVKVPGLGANEGYIYVFDRKTGGFEEENGEILSKNKVEPLMVIRIKREDFRPTVRKI